MAGSQRASFRPAVAAALAAARGPTLVFDRERLARNFTQIAAAARAHDITLLFAAKSFAHPEVWALAAEHCAGFDVASPGELAALPPARILSIADPTGRATAPNAIVVCETIEQVAAAPRDAAIALRVSASLTGRDPAIGAILDGSGHRRSRFGVTDLAPLHAAVGDRRVGLHVHHGPITATSPERFVATALAALALADFTPAFLDVGGAWHALPDIAAAFAALRAAVPREIEVIAEPGRVFAADAGFACGDITLARTVDDRPLRVLELSRTCHLRWSAIELVARAPHAGAGSSTTFVGPTCFEEDHLGDWIVDPADFPTGTRCIFRGVTGYAVGWNTGFGGIPPATVAIV